MVQAVQQHLQPLPRLAHTCTALCHALCLQLPNRPGLRHKAIELAEPVARLPHLPLQLSRQAPQATGQATVGCVELAEEGTDSRQNGFVTCLQE